MKTTLKKGQKGFTLAEMLIALALIGIIAAMLIPKLLQSSGQRTDIAKARNLMSLVERSYYEAAQDPEGPSQAQVMFNFIRGRVNGTQTAAGVPAGGCPNANNPQGGFTFADGTAVTFYAATNVNAAGVVPVCFDLKANNAAGNNGDDLFWGRYSYVSAVTPVKFNWDGVAAADRDTLATGSVFDLTSQ